MTSCNLLIDHYSNKYCLTFLFWFFIFLESSSSDNEEEAVISVLNMSQPADKSVRKKQGNLSNKPATVLAVRKVRQIPIKGRAVTAKTIYPCISWPFKT